MTITPQDLAEHHIPTVLDACSDWRELAHHLTDDPVAASNSIAGSPILLVHN